MSGRRLLRLSGTGGLSCMQAHALETLEYDALLDQLARHAQSPLGRARALALAPSGDPKHITAELRRTTETVRYLNERGRFGLGGLADPQPPLHTLPLAGRRP